jgi:hypothetical protein
MPLNTYYSWMRVVIHSIMIVGAWMRIKIIMRIIKLKIGGGFKNSIKIYK